MADEVTGVVFDSTSDEGVGSGSLYTPIPTSEDEVTLSGLRGGDGAGPGAGDHSPRAEERLGEASTGEDEATRVGTKYPFAPLVFVMGTQVGQR